MAEGWDIRATGAAPVELEIGMRWQSLWRLAAAPWVPLAFLRMLRAPEDGSLLSTRLRVTPAGPVLVQRWRDRASVDAWSRDPGAAHRDGRRRLEREAGGTASWGIWHRVGPARL